MTTTIRSLVTGLLLGAFAVNSMSAVIDYEPGVSVKFGPSSTVAGINVGSIAGDPSSPVNGDLWYDSTANELTARINGANVALGAGGSSTLTSTYVGYGSGANAVTGEAAFTYDSTLNILGVNAIKLSATGIGITAPSSGVLKLEGLGSGFDEAINMDFDTTSNVVQTSSPATGVTIMDYLDMSLRVTDGGGNFATLGPSGITVHNSAWAGNYILAFGGTDGDAETIASQEWVTANAAAFDATAVDAVTWSDGANASNVWTFNLSGTDPAITFVSGVVNVSTGALQVAGVAVPTISSADTLTNKRITSRVATLTDAATVTPATDSYDGGILTSLSQATNFANPTGTPTEFQSYVLRIKSTTTQALTWGTQFRGGVDIALPTATTGSSKTDYLKFTWNVADSKWDITARAMGY